MKTFLKFASIPLGLFAVFFAIPWLFQALFNAHSDIGLGVIVLLVCGTVGYMAMMLAKTTNPNKENYSED